MSVDDLYQRLVSSINEARMSAVMDFGAVELVGFTSVHVAKLLEAAVPFLNCQTDFKSVSPVEAMPKDTFRFMGVHFRVMGAPLVVATRIWWQLRAIRTLDTG